jgi:NADH-quinone oxidoreductase subunit J
LEVEEQMSGADFAFYLFAFLTLLFGALVILSRNPVTGAMFLVLTIVAMAGLFIQLHAFFLAAVQILVYAGAVMVLFLFVIMLVHVKSVSRKKLSGASAVTAVVGAAALGYLFIRVILHSPGARPASGAAVEGTTYLLGTLLFTRFLLPFEALSLLLLVAMIGVILLSKKNLK